MNRVTIYRKSGSKKSRLHPKISLGRKTFSVKTKVKRSSTHIVKWGENKIELSPNSKEYVIVYNASTNLPFHRVSKSLRRIAEILKKSHNANIRRLGYDILEEHYEGACY